MSNEKMRAEFEGWYSSRHDGFMPNSYDGEYDWADCQDCWEAWQASRAVLVVELPPKISEFNTDENGFVNPAAAEHDEAIDDCRAAIEAAGVQVK